MRNTWKASLAQVQIAVVGANGSGKSALTVKYITRKFIGEYDPRIEDTYCKHDLISSKEVMVWIMDTVEGEEKDPNRYLSWADAFFVVYSVTNRSSFEYAEKILKLISNHNHQLCNRQHLVYLVGNKTDLERYRQVSMSQGSELASKFTAKFYETSSCDNYFTVKQLFHDAIASVSNLQAASRAASPSSGCESVSSASPRPLSTATSDSDKNGGEGEDSSPTSRSTRRGRARTKSPGLKDLIIIKHEKAPSAPSSLGFSSKKFSNTGLKLFKLFQLNGND